MKFVIVIALFIATLFTVTVNAQNSQVPDTSLQAKKDTTQLTAMPQTSTPTNEQTTIPVQADTTRQLPSTTTKQSDTSANHNRPIRKPVHDVKEKKRTAHKQKGKQTGSPPPVAKAVAAFIPVYPNGNASPVSTQFTLPKGYKGNIIISGTIYLDFSMVSLDGSKTLDNTLACSIKVLDEAGNPVGTPVDFYNYHTTAANGQSFLNCFSEPKGFELPFKVSVLAAVKTCRIYVVNAANSKLTFTDVAGATVTYPVPVQLGGLTFSFDK